MPEISVRIKNSKLPVIAAAMIMVIVMSLPAFAQPIAGFVAKNENGDLYEYSYDDLIDSYALAMLGSPDGFYEDFAEKKTYAILLKTGNYIDYKDLLDRYAMALVSGEKFDLEKYAETGEAKIAPMPATIKAVKLSSGQIEFNTKRISAISEIIEIDPDYRPPGTKTAMAGPAKVTADQARKWAESHGAHKSFIDIAELYWKYGEETSIRPELLYAQAAIETRFGKFSAALSAEANNWGGIRVADPSNENSDNYETFTNKQDGVRAHFNHLCAYIGFDPVGEPHDRYHVVKQQSWAGSILYVEDLSGKWTTSKDYHTYILFAIDQMQKIEVEEEEIESEPNTVRIEDENNQGNNGNEEANSGNDNSNEENSDQDNEKERSDSDSGGNSDKENLENNPAEKHVVVDVNILHLREGPSTDDEILERLPLGTVLVVTGNQAEWLSVIVPGGEKGWVHGDYVILLDSSSTKDVLKGKIIAVDPGHGGADPGAIGYSGLKEKEVNLTTALELSRLLKAAGAEVVLTRTGDQTVNNLRRVNLANDSGADLYVSIHANAYSKNESNGTETFYYSNSNNSSESRFLAGVLQKELVDVLRLRNRGVKTNSFYVLKNTDMPAALVEMAFLTNPEEEKMLRDEKVLHSAAEALYRGIAEFFTYNR